MISTRIRNEPNRLITIKMNSFKYKPIVDGIVFKPGFYR